MNEPDASKLHHSAPAHSQGTDAIFDDMSDLSDVPTGRMDVDDDDTSSLSSLPSDDEDINVKEDKDDGTAMKGKKRLSSLLEDESEYEQPKKKTKKTNSSKKTSVSKKKEKKTKKDKGKGKMKAVEESDDEQDKQVKRGKKQLLAKEVKWKDIPDWKKRDDCPLLELPVEILDLIFAPSSGLKMRDYISLAGVSRMFRLRLTPEFFHVLACDHPVLGGRYNSAEQEAKKLQIPLNRSVVNRIFSRDVEDWRVYPSRKSKLSPLSHYVPHGPRENWSQAQYIVYKEEQRKSKIKVKELMRSREVTAAAEAEKAREKYHKTIRVSWQNRTVLAVIQGRESGQPPIKKDANGLPITPPKVQVEDAGISLPHVDPHLPTKYDEESVQSPPILTNEGWNVPDSSDDEDDELEAPTRWNERTGEKVIFDHYPSKWRKKLVGEIQEQNINKTTAMSRYKVSEAELLCLKCTLVPNSMSSTSPQQIFSEAAVEALAYRSHGGPVGHAAHLKTVEERAEKAAATRAAKIAKAKADGTYVEKKTKPVLPPYLWAFRNEIYASHDLHCGDWCDCNDSW